MCVYFPTGVFCNLSRCSYSSSIICETFEHLPLLCQVRSCFAGGSTWQSYSGRMVRRAPLHSVKSIYQKSTNWLIAVCICMHLYAVYLGESFPHTIKVVKCGKSISDLCTSYPAVAATISEAPAFYALDDQRLALLGIRPTGVFFCKHPACCITADKYLSGWRQRENWRPVVELPFGEGHPRRQITYIYTSTSIAPSFGPKSFRASAGVLLLR